MATKAPADEPADVVILDVVEGVGQLAGGDLVDLGGVGALSCAMCCYKRWRINNDK